MNNTILDLEVTTPRHCKMSLDYFFDRLISEYKKDYPDCFDKTDFYDYVNDNIDILIRDVFELKDDEEISDDEIDYVFNLFDKHFDAFFSK